MKTHVKVTLAAPVIAGLLGGLGLGMILNSAPAAHAEYSWVANESASICNGLYLQSRGYDWLSITISSLQLSHDIGRAEAVNGIRQAASAYCPQYLSSVPAH
jgi:hypothetical protein